MAITKGAGGVGKERMKGQSGGSRCRAMRSTRSARFEGIVMSDVVEIRARVDILLLV